MKPSVLLISLDAVRADHLSCYGYERETTPFLGQFASECITYKNAYSAANWTLPSHVSIVTGTSMYRHRVGSHEHKRRKLSNPQLITLAEYLRAYGYETVAFTNCGFLSVDTHFDRGFMWFRWMEEFVNRYHPFYPKQLFGKYWGRILNNIYWNRRYNKNDLGAAATCRAFQEWMTEIRNPQKPFFAFIHLFEAHAPYRTPPKIRERFGPVSNEVVNLAETPHIPWYHLTGRRTLRAGEFEELTRMYDAAIYYQDQILKRLLLLLEEAGVVENTLIIITSDHGEMLGEHGAFGHTGVALYEPAIRVPLMFRLPHAEGGGRTFDAPVSHLDIFPTIRSETGHSSDSWLERQLEGKCLTDCSSAENHVVVTESPIFGTNKLQAFAPEFDLQTFDHHIRSVRWKQYKMVWSDKGRRELYNLKLDPRETSDIIYDAQDIASAIEKRVLVWQSEAEPYEVPIGTEDKLENDALREHLRGLGYLE